MRRILIPVLALLLLSAMGAFAQDYDYIGLKRCSMCHKGERNGMIAEKWAETAHAKAYETLTGDAAAKVYADLGKSGNPAEDADCLKCHVTGVGSDKTENANGVSCEACHGAGSGYWKKTIMEDREQAIANGMVADVKTVCTDCHNEESPTFKGFNLDEMYPQIEHHIGE